MSGPRARARSSWSAGLLGRSTEIASSLEPLSTQGAVQQQPRQPLVYEERVAWQCGDLGHTQLFWACSWNSLRVQHTLQTYSACCTIAIKIESVD